MTIDLFSDYFLFSDKNETIYKESFEVFSFNPINPTLANLYAKSAYYRTIMKIKVNNETTKLPQYSEVTVRIDHVHSIVYNGRIQGK